MEIIIRKRQDLRLLVLVECGQLYLPSYQIAGFFDNQYLWNESMNVLDFLHGDNYQGKVASEQGQYFLLAVGSCTTCPIRQQDSLIISISGRASAIFQIFCMKIVITQRQYLGLPFLVEFGQLCLSSNLIVGFFDHGHLWKESNNILGFLDVVSHQGKATSSITNSCVGQLSLLSSQIAEFFEHQYVWKESVNWSRCFAWR